MRETDIQLTDENVMANSPIVGIKITPTDIHPYVAYSTLKSILGKPSVEFNDDEEWSWYIKVFDNYLHVYSYDDTWRIMVLTKNEQIANDVSKELIELIRKQSPKYLAKLKNLSSTASGFIFQNPYSIYFENAKNILDKAKEVKDDSVYVWKAKKERTDLCRSAFFLFVASFEGFMNLIYELYLRPSLRDERIYSRLAREQVDIKLRLAPMYCLCFNDEVIDHRNDEFQRFQYIADLRNDFIHANLTKPMRTPIVQEDKHSFVVTNEIEGKYGLPRSIVELDVRHIEFVQKVIEDMVNIVIETMKPRYKHEFRPIVSEDEIYVDVVDNEYIAFSVNTA